MIRLHMIVEGQTEEAFDDGADTAPSKRIIGEIPEYEYEKPVAGPLIAERIGLSVMNTECRHFREWLERLEPDD